jgi:lipoic acid synthetase
MEETHVRVKESLVSCNLHTVCEEARCPNISMCWGWGTAIIMIMGDICSRRCKSCSIRSGKPVFLDPEEPKNVAEAIKGWGLGYVVITSVCRDDIEDGGAEHMATTNWAVKARSPTTILETLIPDFKGELESIKKYSSIKARSY